MLPLGPIAVWSKRGFDNLSGESHAPAECDRERGMKNLHPLNELLALLGLSWSLGNIRVHLSTRFINCPKLSSVTFASAHHIDAFARVPLPSLEAVTLCPGQQLQCICRDYWYFDHAFYWLIGVIVLLSQPFLCSFMNTLLPLSAL